MQAILMGSNTKSDLSVQAVGKASQLRNVQVVLL